ncbi:MAG: DUF1624 domain-containing protein [Candidatus Heimdallarchaeota archaeon]|nr:DUF1624 domain-containing protein [Candidatus Heimdallarchaeota archaeon]
MDLRVDSQYQISQKEKHSQKRFVSLDFQRGLAIWLMTFLHTFEHLYNYDWVKKDPQKVLDLPLPILVVGLFVGFFASWNAYFLLISSTVNSLSMTKQARKGREINQILLKQLLTGVGILAVGYLTDSLLYNGYLGTAISTGDWTNTYPLWYRFFAMHTLQIIGWSLIINAIIHSLLMRNKGYEKYRRNMIVYAFLALLVISLSPFIHNWVDNMSWLVPQEIPMEVGLGDHSAWPSIHLQAHNASFKTWVMALIAGDLEPLFPYLATSFAGSMVGLALAKPKPPKRLPAIGGGISVSLMGFGGLFLALGFFTMNNNRPALGNYLLMLGGQLGALFFFLWLMEYRGKSKQIANRHIVKHFRLWGMASLSIYCLAIFELLPRWFLSSMINLIFSEEVNLLKSSLFGYGQEYLAILVAIYVILAFELMVFLWSKFNFKFSFEWFIIHFTSLGTGSVSQRLNVDLMMNHIHWINIKEILAKDKISGSIDKSIENEQNSLIEIKK